MENIETGPLQTKEERQTAGRSRLYWLFSDMFRYPDASSLSEAGKGEVEQAFENLFRSLPYELTLSREESEALRLPERLKIEDMEVEFVRLFESGIGGPPCPLVESAYCEDRKVVFKELILFYNHFGMSYAEGAKDERPDHICLETEFLHWLTFKEVHALQQAMDPDGYRRGQRDFLARHLHAWVKELDKRLENIWERLLEDVCREAILFYRILVKMLERFLEQEVVYLQARLAD